MLPEAKNYEMKVREFIITLVNILNNKIQTREIELNSPAGKITALDGNFKSESCALFNLILDSIRSNCKNEELGFNQFYNILPNTAKHPKYVAGALITYLLNWKNIRKRNFGALSRKDFTSLLDSTSMSGLDKVFPVVFQWVKKLDGYGAIYLPSSKYVSHLDLDFLVKKYLKHYSSITIKANLIEANRNTLLNKSLETYNQLLDKFNSNFRKQAVKQLFSHISPIKDPGYLASSIVYYTLLKGEGIELLKACTKSRFSESVRLKRKMFSDSFNIVQSALNRVLDYDTLYLENQIELGLSAFLKLMKRNLLTIAKNLTLGNELVYKALRAFDSLLDVFYKDNRELGFKVFSNAFKQQEIGYRHFFSALLFTVYEIDSYDKNSPLPKQNEISNLLKINYPKFNVGVNFIRNYLKHAPKYKVIHQLSPSKFLSDGEYFRLITNYITDYCKIFKKSNKLPKRVIEIYEKCLNKDFYANLPSGSRQPKLIASAFLCIYLNYFNGVVIPQKEFVKQLNRAEPYKIRYHGFNDLYSFISDTYFTAEKEEYKRKLITSRDFHHKGKIYHFKVNVSKLETIDPEIKKGLSHLITEILKEKLPRSFFREMKGYRASDLVLKGDKSAQLFTTRRGTLGSDINLKEHLIDTLKHKVEHGENFELCAIAKEVINNYKKEGLTPPDNSFHEPILTKLLEGNGDAIAMEIPIWKEVKKIRSFFTGHIDLITVKGDTLYICDYKKDTNEIYKSLPQIASYGIMVKERIKHHCNLNTFKVRCLSFSSHTALEFDPEILRVEIKEFARLWQKKKNKPMMTRGTNRRILDDIEKLICVES